LRHCNLVNLKIGVRRDHRATRVVYTLSWEVATETSCLALKSLHKSSGGLLWLCKIKQQPLGERDNPNWEGGWEMAHLLPLKVVCQTSHCWYIERTATEESPSFPAGRPSRLLKSFRDSRKLHFTSVITTTSATRIQYPQNKHVPLQHSLGFSFSNPPTSKTTAAASP